MAKVTYVDMSQMQYKIENRGHNGTLIGKGTYAILNGRGVISNELE